MFGFKKERKFGTLALMFVVGAITGAAVALLYAPYPGKKLQKQLKDVVEDGVDNVQKIVKRAVA
jgi:gas vesicle protein